MENSVTVVLLISYTLAWTDAQEVTTSADVCRNKTSTHVDKERDFFNCLKKNYDYSLNLKRNTEVVFSYQMQDIFYSSFSGIFLTGMLEMEWQDDNFVWTKGLSQISSRKVVGLWKPEIYMNSLSNTGSDRRLFRTPLVSDQSGGSVVILRTGRVIYMVQAVLVAMCPQQDLKFFPYDVQTCQIELFSIQNVTFKTDETLGPYFLLSSDMDRSSYKILDYNISTGRGQGDSMGGPASSVFIRVKFVRYDLMFWIKLYTPNLALCLFLLMPFCVSPGHKLRLILPTFAFLAILRQVQTLIRIIPEMRVYTGDILMLDLYRNLLVLSLAILAHNFFSCLLWRKKAFLPALLNRGYARLYKMGFCRKLTEVEAYFELEQQQETPGERPDSLETAFHTWCELLRLVDILLFILVLAVEVYSFVPTLNISSLRR